MERIVLLTNYMYMYSVLVFHLKRKKINNVWYEYGNYIFELTVMKVVLYDLAVINEWI